ncbi:MAG: histidine phosphatase family protein [Alphaproteobacteria bacterium]|nr:histidine phosphatase family protein [Alphaproteobacteria bacterium]
MGERRQLYLIRHGQTEWNLKGRLQGGKDSPLTALGRQQASAVATSLGANPPSSILASPLGRAKKTAEIIAKALDIPVTEDERLGEIRFGAAEGMSWCEINNRWPELMTRREQDKWHVGMPDGENYQDADGRIAPFVTDLLRPKLTGNGEAPLAIVGHETMNMILLGRLLDLEPSTVTCLGQPNHVLYRLQDRLVDHAHLGDDRLDWIPGMLQKRSDEILHVAA